VAGLAASFGSGAMTNPVSDISKAEVILIIGSNTTENHPIISHYVKRAVKFNGQKLIVADPRNLTIAQFAEKWIRPTPGTDVAWINGVIHVILKEGLQDQAFIDHRCDNYGALVKSVEPFTPEHVEMLTGIDGDDIVAVARLYAGAENASILYCMGITQHSHGTDNVKALANLAMVTGNLGRAGTGVNPLRGQNNVQGACDMGGLPNVFTGYQPVTDTAIVKRMETAWGVTGMSVQEGLTVTEMVPKAHDGELKCLYVVGENPLVSDPDLSHAEESFKNLEFLVVQDIFLTETAQLADVVFPAKAFAEKNGTFTNTERKVQRVRKAVNGPGNAKADWEIIAGVSTAMGYPMACISAEEIFQEISRVTPSYAGITYAGIDEEGLHWPCPIVGHPGTPVLHTKSFSRGKGLFHEIAFTPPAEGVDDTYPLVLTTGRVLYHYHTGTMTRKSDGLNDRSPECFVEISPEDASRYHLKDQSMADVYSRRGKIRVKVKISQTACEGTIFIPFHFAEAAVNRLTSAALDPVAKIPEYKVCAVAISPG